MWNVVNEFPNLMDGLIQKEDRERMNKVSDVRVCVASSSYLMCALCGTIYLEDNVYNNENLLDIVNKLYFLLTTNFI